jgi:hypothetical protein
VFLFNLHHKLCHLVQFTPNTICFILPPYQNICYHWLFLTTLTIGLIQKIMRVPHILFVICFIVVGILNLHYPFIYLQYFSNKTSGQSCTKKSIATSISIRREYFFMHKWSFKFKYCKFIGNDIIYVNKYILKFRHYFDRVRYLNNNIYL